MIIKKHILFKNCNDEKQKKNKNFFVEYLDILLHPTHFWWRGVAIIVAFTVLKLKSKKYKAIVLHYHIDKDEKIYKYFVVELDENGKWDI